MLFVSVTVCSLAQITKGSFLLGGDLSSFSEKQINNGIENKISGFHISPFVGKAIKDNLFFGGYFNLGLTDNDGNNGSVKIKGNNYGAGLFLRKYSVIKNNFYGFLQGNVGVNYYKEEGSFSNNSSSEFKRTLVMVALSPGLSYKISKKLHLESGLREMISLGYSTQKNFNNSSGSINTSKNNRLYFSSNINNFTSNLYFGFRLILDKK